MSGLKDSQWIRDLLTANYPGIKIRTAVESGQRLVYFVSFHRFERYNLESDSEEICEWDSWGNVVLKVSDTKSSVELARMETELHVLNQIDSPHYPKVYFYESLTYNPTTDEKLNPKYFVSIEEEIPSTPLCSCLHHYSSEEKIADLAIKLICALQSLWEHPKQYVHRDIKPANILIKEDGNIAIIDLGILRETGSTGLTNTIFPMGPCTPGYSSPEQITNDKKNISYKSDLFSIGAIMYEATTGKNPFRSPTDSLHEIVENTIQETPPKPPHKLIKCSEQLSLIIMKLLEKQPHRRYRKIATLLRSLESLKGNV